jgi:hypothetical protein
MAKNHNGSTPEPGPNRSVVTNGTRTFLGKPGGEQTAVGLRWKDIAAAITEDLGGADLLSEIERQLVRRVTHLSIEAELMEADRVKGQEIDIDKYISITNAIGRAGQRVGLRRRARNISPPTVKQLIEGSYG